MKHGHHIAYVLAAPLLALALTVQQAAPSAAQKPSVPDQERLQAAKKLMQVSGASRNFDTIIPLMVRQIKGLIKIQYKDRGDAIDEIFARVAKRFSSQKHELIDKIAGLYARELTTFDMNEMSTFFASGAGQRFVAAQPKLMRGSAGLGQAWGRKIGQEIVAEVRDEMQKRGVSK